MDAAIFKKLHPSEYLKRFLDGPSVRADGRSPSAARRAALTTASITSAVGSAMAKLGRTTAVAGVEATLAPPPTTAVDQSVGSLAIAVHVPALAGGPQSGSSGATGSACNADIQGLAAFVRENTVGNLDLAALCVEDGVLVWNLKLSVYCIDHDGNIEDAMLLAATAALLNVRLPTVRLIDDLPEGDPDARVYSSAPEDPATGGPAASTPPVDEDDKVLAVVSEDRPVRLGMTDFCLSASFAVFEDHFLLDPCRDEELVAHSRVTLVLRSNGGLRAVHKPGGAAVAVTAIGAGLSVAQKQVADLVGAMEAGDLPAPQND